MRHHAIVVTGYGPNVVKAREVAYDISCDIEQGRIPPGVPILHVTAVTPEGLNGYRSFLIAPDGSKEFWSESDDGDEWCDRFVQYLSDRSLDVSWVEVQFGDDDGQNKVTKSS